MLRSCTLLSCLLAASYSSIAQEVPDSGARRVDLDEIVVNDRPLKQFRYVAPSLNAHWLFKPGNEKNHRFLDSTFNMVAVPELGSRPIRLQYVNFHLKPWDTGRMRLNMIVLQIKNADTTYWIRPLPMQVRRNWLRVSPRAGGLLLPPGPFYVGYSVTAFSIPEEFRYRLFTHTSQKAATATINGGRLCLPPEAQCRTDFPLRLEYDEL